MAGSIHADAVELFDDPTSEEHKAIRPFLAAGFDVTWAKWMNLFNCRQLFCFLRPDIGLREAYGFRYEVVVVFHPYPSLEPRAFQAITAFMATAPAKGRVDAMLYFLVSKDRGCAIAAMQYLLENKEERIAIPIAQRDLVAPESDGWTVRNALQQHYLTLDRFKNTLPLREDTYFFGRQRELGKLLDAVRQGENSGLFGLRKTGKTSLLFKLQRALERDPSRRTFYLDAQSTSVRLKRWNELLQFICKGLFRAVGKVPSGSFAPGEAADDFAAAVNQFLVEAKVDSVTVIIDEVEWISPGTARDAHWNVDYANFWHAIRSFQTITRKLQVVIAGVNPSMVETDSIGGFQNPLFGIVNVSFLGGLLEVECAEMVQNIGRVMGMRFDGEALQYIQAQYAGHPMLTRLACSFTADVEKASGIPFPLTVTRDSLVDVAGARDRELRFYCGHIVSELAQFYPAEYELLELLATGRDDEFRAKARFTSSLGHLRKYGILDERDLPAIRFEVLRGYISEENARREGRATRVFVVPVDGRRAFIQSRMRSIIEDMRALERDLRVASFPELFGPASFTEAERLLLVEPPVDDATLGMSLTPLYRSFVESIDRYGQSRNVRNYFWSVIKQYYPHLFDALLRIRVYRHDRQHAELKPDIQQHLKRFVEQDLEGTSEALPDRHWIQFQRCVDELHRALQVELAKRREEVRSATNLAKSCPSQVLDGAPPLCWTRLMGSVSRVDCCAQMSRACVASV